MCRNHFKASYFWALARHRPAIPLFEANSRAGVVVEVVRFIGSRAGGETDGFCPWAIKMGYALGSDCRFPARAVRRMKHLPFVEGLLFTGIIVARFRLFLPLCPASAKKSMDVVNGHAQ